MSSPESSGLEAGGYLSADDDKAPRTGDLLDKADFTTDRFAKTPKAGGLACNHPEFTFPSNAGGLTVCRNRNIPGPGWTPDP